VNDDCLKLTTYFGERERVDGGFLADAFTGIYARHALQTSVVIRGVEGFGAKQLLRTDRQLTLSEDLPIVSVAVDTRERIETALEDVEALTFNGLVTLERARMLTAPMQPVVLTPGLQEAAKLTVYVGRQERIGRHAAYEVIVGSLQGRGVAAATVLLGVDGTAHGVRQRARFFDRNAQVPLMVIAVGAGPGIAAAASELGRLLERPLMTLERVRVCKRDGRTLTEPWHSPASDGSGLGVWQKLMVYTGEQAEHAGQPIYRRLVQALRGAGAAGATSVRGIWGYDGDHAPHGDSFWRLRRRVPVLTVIVDTPERSRRWYEIADELTTETGLITSELVPAYRATGPAFKRGGLHLAQRMR
jgi:PII-like signaling protein